MFNDWFKVSSDVAGQKHGASFWNHDNGYRMQSLTADSDSPLGWLLDPTGTVAGLWNDITGASSQSREFAQQEYLMDKQNEYNLPVNQMARMKAAGINPNTAAIGIAQGGNESAQAPAVASNEQGVANGIGQAAAAISGIGALPATVANLAADSAAKEAVANETNQLLSLKGGLFRAQTYDAFTHAGLNFHQAAAFEIENQYRGIGLCLDIAAKRAQLPILRQTFRNLQAEYDVKMKNIEVMEQEIRESASRISLNEGLALQARKNAAYLEANTWYQARINQTMQNFNFDPRWATNSVLFGIGTNLDISDEDASQHFDAILDIAYKANRYASQGTAEGAFDVQKGLIKEQEAATGRLQGQQGKIDISKGLYNHLLDEFSQRGKSFGVGPFHYSN